MRILITGAAGFLGREFLKFHLANEDEVTAVDDLSSKYAYFPTGVYTKIRMDVVKLLRMFLKEESWDRVYHFAAPVGGREKIEGDPLYNARSLEIDSALFRWAAAQKQKPLIIYPSSSAVYGVKWQGFDNWSSLPESYFHAANLSWDKPDEMYGFTKMAGEMLALSSSRYGISTLCIRPFSGYGEEQSFEYPFPSIVRRAFDREDPFIIWGSGQQQRDFIHVSDIVAGTISRIDAGVTGYQTFNLGSGIGTTFTGLANMAAGMVGYTPKIENDQSKPEGVGHRVADVTTMFKFYKPTVSLRDGVARMLTHLERTKCDTDKG